MSASDMNVNTNVGPAGSLNSSLDGSFSGAGLTEPVTQEQSKSWFEAMAKAWGKAMDQKAAEIVSMSSSVSQGGDNQPSEIVQLQAKAQEFGFLSQSEASSVNAVGDGQQAMARKS